MQNLVNDYKMILISEWICLCGSSTQLSTRLASFSKLVQKSCARRSTSAAHSRSRKIPKHLPNTSGNLLPFHVWPLLHHNLGDTFFQSLIGCHHRNLWVLFLHCLWWTIENRFLCRMEHVDVIEGISHSNDAEVQPLPWCNVLGSLFYSTFELSTQMQIWEMDKLKSPLKLVLQVAAPERSSASGFLSAWPISSDSLPHPPRRNCKRP